MGANALPFPSDEQRQGPGPGGGFPSPAPAGADKGNAQLLEMVRSIVTAARMIGKQVPGAVPEVQQINDLVARIQQKVLQQQGPAEPQAPPV